MLNVGFHIDGFPKKVHLVCMSSVPNPFKLFETLGLMLHPPAG